MFKRRDEIVTFIDYMEEFILSVINHRTFPRLETATTLNRKREAFEDYICVMSGIFKDVQDEPDTYKCPECGGDMAERYNRVNQNKFYGCKKYPDCRGTRDENGLSRADREEAKYKKEQVSQQNRFSFNKAKRQPWDPEREDPDDNRNTT